MARIARSLTTLALIFFLLPSGREGALAQDTAYRSPRFYRQISEDGKVFPVLLPADGRWLNWRDTYGAPRMRLVNGVWQQVGVHQGIDIFAEKGSPIVSISAGRVENLGWTFYSGWRVGVRGSDGRYYFYAHMIRDLAAGIRIGARVSPGTLLGRVGNSGYGPEGTQDEFPPHLHFGLESSSGWENPNLMLTELYQASVGKIREGKHEIRALELSLIELRKGTNPQPGRSPEDEAALEERKKTLEETLYYVP